MSFLRDLRVAFRSLARTKGLAVTVVLTLALGIGANAAIFSLVRGVLLRPLVNRDENRLIYIQQSAPGISPGEVPFSVPEIQDLRAGVKTLSSFGEFSTVGFTMIGLGEPREVRAGVVDGSYFDVVGLHPVLGRLVGPQDDGPKAAGVVVLTYRFWSTTFKSDPSVIRKAVRLGSGFGDRSATIIGVLEPSIPYPADTEIIANIVTSPHHLSATMQNGRVHHMTELFGRLATGVTLEQARAELRTIAVTQIAASFMLLAGASMLLKTLIALQTVQTGLDTRHVLAINVPAMSYGKTPQQVVDFYKESIRRVDALPGVNKTAFGMFAPWRDTGTFGPGLQFSADGHVRPPGEEDPRAQMRVISPGFFAALGVPIVAGRDFNALDGQSKEPVVI